MSNAPQQTLIEDLKTCLLSAIEIFNEIDASTLLSPGRYENRVATKGSSRWSGASERAISHRLAVYLERMLYERGVNRICPSLTIDCEYNRHLDGDKIQRVSDELVGIVEAANRVPRPATDDESFYVFSVAPDIVVHQRRSDELNLLVIEVKKSSNRENPQYDELKLSGFTASAEYFGYKLGAAVIAEDDVAPENRKLRLSGWFVDGATENRSRAS